MSLIANGFGNFLSLAAPFYQSLPAIVTPGATIIKPGGRIAAYVRSTGVQDGEEHFSNSGLLVTSTAAGLARCRANQNDILYYLPGHTETFSSTGSIFGSALVAGVQFVGVGVPGATNNPTWTLSHTGASVALSAANCTVSGMNITTGTASTTGFIVVTGAGVTMAGNFITNTAALGANPCIAVTGAAQFKFIGNHVVANCTDPMIEISNAATTHMEIVGNFLRQAQATSGGDFVAIADTDGISGVVAYNIGKTARAGTPGTGFDLDAANIIANLLNQENYTVDNVATSGTLATGATFS